MKEVISIIGNFIKDRPVMADNNVDPDSMKRLLLAEIEEYFQEESPEAKARELADIIWFAITIAIVTGIDIEAEVRDKAARNHLKRPAVDWQEGDYYLIDAEARRTWKKIKGDEDFYSDQW